MEERQSIKAQLKREESRLRASIRKWTVIPIIAGALVLVASYWMVKQARNDVAAVQAEIAILSKERDELLRSKGTAEEQLKMTEAELARITEQLTKSRAAAEHIRKGINYYQRGDYNEAIAEYKQALQVDPMNFVVYDWAGYAYYRKHDYYEAISHLRRSVQINPRYARGYYNLALALWGHGDHEAAVDAVEMALSLDDSIRKDLLQDGQFRPFRESQRFILLIRDSPEE